MEDKKCSVSKILLRKCQKLILKVYYILEKFSPITKYKMKEIFSSPQIKILLNCFNLLELKEWFEFELLCENFLGIVKNCLEAYWDIRYGMAFKIHFLHPNLDLFL